jgi:hypothetical protein
MENSNKNILQTSLADRLSQNSTVSGWFPIQQRTIGARPLLACLLHMKCEEVVLKTKRFGNKYTQKAIAVVRLC